MTATWRVAAVQTDCRLGRPADNLAAIRAKLHEAADGGARLVVFPECVLTGYGFPTRAAALACAEPLPGPSADALAADCARRGVWVAFGLLERAGDMLFNACALVGPTGLVGSYRKTHLPRLGADRFTDPGDRPFAVHDLGGLRVGMNVCFDGSYPEASRVLAVLGADLIVLPTNWPDQAVKSATLVPPVRALENHVYYLTANRVGTEAGVHYIGRSAVFDPAGDPLAAADHDREAILYADIDPAAARRKTVVYAAGEYEIDRVNWRRPDLYGPLTAPPRPPFAGHQGR